MQRWHVEQVKVTWHETAMRLLGLQSLRGGAFLSSFLEKKQTNRMQPFEMGCIFHFRAYTGENRYAEPNKTVFNKD